MMAKTDHDLAVIQAMIDHGGSFVKALGHAFRAADMYNFARLKDLFREYWIEYEGWVSDDI